MKEKEIKKQRRKGEIFQGKGHRSVYSYFPPCSPRSPRISFSSSENARSLNKYKRYHLGFFLYLSLEGKIRLLPLFLCLNGKYIL